MCPLVAGRLVRPVGRHQGVVEAIEFFLRMKIKGDSPFTLPELNFSPSLPAFFELLFGSQNIRVLACRRWAGRLLEPLGAPLRIPDGKTQLDDLLS